MTQEQLSIGSLSRLTGVSVRALRYYESKGLLKAHRATNGYRKFSSTAVVKVQSLRRLLSLGFNLDEIATFPRCMLEGNDGVCQGVTSIHQRRLREVEEQIRALEAQKTRLRALLQERNESHET